MWVSWQQSGDLQAIEASEENGAEKSDFSPILLARFTGSEIVAPLARYLYETPKQVSLLAGYENHYSETEMSRMFIVFRPILCMIEPQEKNTNQKN